MGGRRARRNMDNATVPLAGPSEQSSTMRQFAAAATAVGASAATRAPSLLQVVQTERDVVGGTEFPPQRLLGFLSEPTGRGCDTRARTAAARRGVCSVAPGPAPLAASSRGHPERCRRRCHRARRERSARLCERRRRQDERLCVARGDARRAGAGFRSALRGSGRDGPTLPARPPPWPACRAWRRRPRPIIRYRDRHDRRRPLVRRRGPRGCATQWGRLCRQCRPRRPDLIRQQHERRTRTRTLEIRRRSGGAVGRARADEPTARGGARGSAGRKAARGRGARPLRGRIQFATGRPHRLRRSIRTHSGHQRLPARPHRLHARRVRAW